MNLNMTWSSRGMASNPVLRAGLILFAALAFVLAASGQARAADCSNADACYNAAAWQKAIAQDYSKKAFFAGADAQNNFRAAADWHNKSVGAFLSGNGSAAQLYQAVANDYARKAAASATAANDFAAKAKLTAAAANGNINRAMAITAYTMRGPSAAEENSYAKGAGETGGDGALYTTAKVGEHCINPRNREWKGGGIHVILTAKEFCWQNHQVTGLHVPYDSDITGVADAQLSEDGCTDERWWYAWDINYDHSGRKVLITCRFKAQPAGIIPITVGTLTCRVALYFHANGSYAYTKEDKMRCDKDITLP